MWEMPLKFFFLNPKTNYIGDTGEDVDEMMQ